MSTPASLYRNAIDLNRYSNSVAKQLVVSYNDIIIDAVNQLRTIDDLAAPVRIEYCSNPKRKQHKRKRDKESGHHITP